MNENYAGRRILITDDFIRAGASEGGGWSRTQLELLGVPWPPQHGWKRRIIGRYLTKADADKFISLREAHLSKNKQRKLFNERNQLGFDL